MELLKINDNFNYNQLLNFIFLAGLHLYWAAGREAFAAEVLPMHPNGTFLFQPGPISTIVVAFILLGFAFITIGNSGVTDHLLERKYIHFGTLSIAAIFLVRALGDFKYIGFFKRIKGTAFARKDTVLYSPFSLLIAVISFSINRISL